MRSTLLALIGGATAVSASAAQELTAANYEEFRQLQTSDVVYQPQPTAEEWAACGNVTKEMLNEGKEEILCGNAGQAECANKKGKCYWMYNYIFNKPHMQQTADDLNNCATARCAKAEPPTEDERAAALAVLKRASNDNIYQKWEDSASKELGSGTGAVITGLTNDATALTNIVFWATCFVLVIVCYVFCYCCCWSCPKCRCCRKERGIATMKLKLGLILLCGGIVLSTFIAGTVGVAQITTMAKGIGIMNCGITTLVRNVVAGVPNNKKIPSAFPGMLNLMNTIDDLRKALLPGSKFLSDLGATLDQTDGIEKATALMAANLQLIEDSYNDVALMLRNKEGADNCGTDKNCAKLLVHDKYFDSSTTGVDAGAATILKTLVSSSVNSATRFDTLHESTVALPVATAAAAMNTAVVESAGAQLKTTLAEVKKQFFSSMDGMTKQSRVMMEGAGKTLAAMVDDSIYKGIGRGASTNYLNEENDYLDASEGSLLREYIGLAILMPFLLLIPSLMMGLLATVSFFYSNRDNAARYGTEEYVTKDGEGTGKKEIKYNNMPGLFSCCGYCYAGVVMTVLTLMVTIMIIVGFAGGSICMYFIEDFNGQKFNMTSGKMLGTWSTDMTTKMIDSCLAKDADGMMLKTVMSKSCPMNKTDGTFPETCAEDTMVDMSMDYQIRVKQLGAMRKQFDVADMPIVQIQDSAEYKTFLDLMNVDRLGSIIGNAGFMENKYTIGMLGDKRVQDEGPCIGKDLVPGSTPVCEDRTSTMHTDKSGGACEANTACTYLRKGTGNTVKLTADTFAETAETGMSCFDVNLAQAVVDALPDGSLKRKKKALGINSIVNSLYVTGDFMWPSGSKPAAGANNFLHEELGFPNNKATCGVDIGVKCNAAKRTATTDQEDLVKCKELLKAKGHDWDVNSGDTAGVKTKYDRHLKCLADKVASVPSPQCANEAEDKKFFFHAGAPGTGTGYQCNPCEAGLNMLRLKFGLRNFLPAKKFYVQYPPSVSEAAAWTADGIDTEEQIVGDLTEASKQYTGTAKTATQLQGEQNDLTEMNGCDIGNMLNKKTGVGAKPKFACVGCKAGMNPGCKAPDSATNPFVVSVTTLAHATNGNSEAIYQQDGSQNSIGFSWDAVLATGSMSNFGTDTTIVTYPKVNSSDTTMITYMGASFKRAVERYDGETISMFPKIMGAAPKVDGDAGASQVQVNGTGIKGIVEDFFFQPAEKEVLDRANCNFLAAAWGSFIDGLCYMWVPAIYLTAGAYGYAAFAHFVLICMLKFIWRFVRDNIEMKRQRRRKLMARAEAAEASGESLELTEEEALLLENGPEEEPMVAWLRRTLGYDDDPPAVKFKRAVNKLKIMASLGGGWKNVGERMNAQDQAADNAEKGAA